MIIKAKRTIEVRGFGVVDEGKSIDISPSAITPRIARSFVAEDGSPLIADKEWASNASAGSTPEVEEDERKAKIQRTIIAMKRDGIISALDGMGVTYSPKSKTEYLAKLLLMSRGEIEE